MCMFRTIEPLNYLNGNSYLRVYFEEMTTLLVLIAI